MSDFEKDTDQVLTIFRRPHGPGGELPSHAIAYIPADRAERVTALDERIQQARKAAPLIGGLVAGILVICVSSAGWMAPGLAAVVVAACGLQTFGKYRKGC